MYLFTGSRNIVIYMYLHNIIEHNSTGNEELNAIAEFYAVDVPCVIKNCHEIALKSVKTQVGL